MNDTARDRLHRRATDRRAAALHEWQSLSALGGGVSACALARSGVSFPAGKLAEGRVAALGELLRALKKLADDNAPATLLMDLRDGWRAEAEAAEERYGGGGGGLSRDWIAYRVGGADELDELLLEFGGGA